MLPQDELTRRLIALRTLRGVSQVELAGRLKQDGLGLHDLGKIERGEKDMQAVHRRAIAHHLNVDEDWFTDPDTDRVLGAAQDPATIRNRLDEVLDRVAALELQIASNGLAIAELRDEERHAAQDAPARQQR